MTGAAVDPRLAKWQAIPLPLTAAASVTKRRSFTV
jgi:hypothetical protein